MHRPDDLIQSIADELAEDLQERSFEMLEPDEMVRLRGAAQRVYGYLTDHYQLVPLRGGGN